MTPAPERVRVTRSPRQPRPQQPRTVREEITGQSRLGTTYVTSLIRAQWHLTLGVLTVGGLTLGALPAIFALIPASRSLSIAGVPVVWPILGVLVYPGVLLIAQWYTRASERIEADFGDIVGRR